MNINNYEIILIGASAGGAKAIRKIASTLPKNFPLPIIIVLHRHHDDINNYFENNLGDICKLNIKEAIVLESIMPGNIYIAPANYHLLIEANKILSLSIDSKVNYCRPSIDVLFESAVDVYTSKIIGIILTGANSDGAEGLKKIKERGGLAIVQSPETAESPAMPTAAINACSVDYMLPIEDIAQLLIKGI